MKLFLMGFLGVFNLISLSVKGKDNKIIGADEIADIKENLDTFGVTKISKVLEGNGETEISEIDKENKRRHKHRDGHHRRHGHHHRKHKHHKLKDEEEAEEDDSNYYDEGGYNENTHGLNVHKTCKHSGQVALTFDDGVMPETSQILDILSKNGVRATFFILASTIDQYPMYRKILHRIIDEGHTLGSHTYSHFDLTGLGAEGVKYELNQAGNIFENACGERPKFMRPPYGSVNREVVDISHKMGYEVVHWNLDTNDWRQTYDTVPIIDSLYHHDDGSMSSKIVLMHVRPITVRALDSVIKYYQKKGYIFVNMEKCLGMKGYF